MKTEGSSGQESRLEGLPTAEEDVSTVPQHLSQDAASGVSWLSFYRGRECTSFSRAEVSALARRWAAALNDAGVRVSDRVILLLPTSIEMVSALVGTQRLGATPVPVPWPFFFDHVDRHLDALSKVVETADPSAVVTTPKVISAGRWGRPVVTSPAPWGIDADLSAPELPAFIQFTSGTTGQPKGAVISHRAALASVHAMGRALDFGPREVAVSWLPLFHDMGLVGALFSSLVFKFPLHLMAPSEFMLHPKRWLTLMSEVGATATVAPNFAYEQVVRRAKNLEGLDLSRLRFALNGSEPVLRSTIASFESHLADVGLSPGTVRPVYGLAENTLGVAFSNPADEDLVFEGRTLPSVGKPLEGTSIQVRDGQGSILPLGLEGEIWVRSPALMSAYYRAPEATAKALVDGWLRTGDLGVVSEGLLYVTGREKELIIKAGRKFHPQEIEQIVCSALKMASPGVAALSFSRSDSDPEELGVVVETRANPDRRVERQLRARIQEVLGVRTDTFRFVPPGALPRTPSGKIRRRACAPLFAEGK